MRLRHLTSVSCTLLSLCRHDGNIRFACGIIFDFVRVSSYMVMSLFRSQSAYYEPSVFVRHHPVEGTSSSHRVVEQEQKPRLSVLQILESIAVVSSLRYYWCRFHCAFITLFDSVYRRETSRHLRFIYGNKGNDNKGRAAAST